MNRAEAINQLNLERKRRENDVWQRWFLALTKDETTSGKLLDRTNELNKIRDDFDKALFRLNQQPDEDTVLDARKSKQNTVAPTNTFPQTNPSTEDTLGNTTSIPGQEIQRKSERGGVPNQREPQVVRQARKENLQEDQEAENNFDVGEEVAQKTESQKKGTSKRKPKLSNTECVVLIILSIITDFLNLTPFINVLVTALIAPCFIWYFRARGVAIAPTIITAIVDAFPAISVLPVTTLGVVITILFDRFGGEILSGVPVVSQIVQK